MHALGAHFNGKSSRLLIFAFEAKCTLAVDVVKNWLIFPLFCACQFSHADSALRTYSGTLTLMVPNCW